MKFKILYLLLFSFLQINRSFSQNFYIVKSIQELPSLNCFIIKVFELNNSHKTNEIWLVSNDNKNNVFENSVKIRKGMRLNKLNLIELTESENPFKSYLQSTRSNQAIYIDKKLIYDPQIKLYLSDCIKGLFYNKRCN